MNEPCVIHGLEWYGHAGIDGDVLRVGDLEINVANLGFWSSDGSRKEAMVFVNRASGVRKFNAEKKVVMLDGFVIAEIHISLLGDGLAQQTLDVENAEAARILEDQGYGAYKTYWVGKGMDPEEFDEFEETQA